MKQASAVLARRHRKRFPFSARTGVRAYCDRHTAPARGSQASMPQEVKPPAPSRKARQAAQTSPEVRAQVEQLQFWLKVFSRFCNEDPHQEPS